MTAPLETSWSRISQPALSRAVHDSATGRMGAFLAPLRLCTLPEESRCVGGCTKLLAQPLHRHFAASRDAPDWIAASGLLRPAPLPQAITESRPAWLAVSPATVAPRVLHAKIIVGRVTMLKPLMDVACDPPMRIEYKQRPGFVPD